MARRLNPQTRKKTMLILLVIFNLFAAPVDRNEIVLEIQTLTKPLTITALDPHKLQQAITIKQGHDDFYCFTTRRVQMQRLEKIAVLLEEMAAGVDTHPNADWGKVHEGITGTLSKLWCNGIASTTKGMIAITFTWNRFCNSAGCNTEYMTVGFSKEQAIEAANQIRILSSNLK
jgi:hypothetical protein